MEQLEKAHSAMAARIALRAAEFSSVAAKIALHSAEAARVRRLQLVAARSARHAIFAVSVTSLIIPRIMNAIATVVASQSSVFAESVAEQAWRVIAAKAAADAAHAAAAADVEINALAESALADAEACRLSHSAGTQLRQALIVLKGIHDHLADSSPTVKGLLLLASSSTFSKHRRTPNPSKKVHFHLDLTKTLSPSAGTQGFQPQIRTGWIDHHC